MTTPSLRSRVLIIDLLKAAAAQFIVLHHLSWYGPLSDQAVQLGPSLAALVGWFAEYGRYAVAVFIVIGGYLSALGLSAQGLPPGKSPGGLMLDRYLRLVVPFAAALLFAIACNLLARQWMSHDSLGSPPQLSQLLAHLLLLHSLLGIESLSTGVWYVAIDFQLYALFVLLLWLGRRPAIADFLPVVMVALAGLASLFYFNRNDAWDDTALYFFGAYSLGIASGWAQRSGRQGMLFWAIAIIGLLALLIEFRDRLAVALVVALLLGSRQLMTAKGESRLIHYLGSTSYALFLVHFPVYQVVSAVFVHAGLDTPWHGLLGLGISWMASLAVADLLHRHVEQPFDRWRKHRQLFQLRWEK